VTSDSPALRYYLALVGAWVGDSVLLRPRAAGLSFLRSAAMSTTLAGEGARVFVHTTKVEKLGVTVFTSRERIELADDGRSFALTGEQRPWPTGRALDYAGAGEIDETGTRATYRFPMFGEKTAQWVGPLQEA
jgi:hypothetical protein